MEDIVKDNKDGIDKMTKLTDYLVKNNIECSISRGIINGCKNSICFNVSKEQLSEIEEILNKGV